MKRSTTPLLGYALLGLLHQKARSGYDLRKIFAETAMGNYSSSPGAIYPALQRLEVDHQIKGTVEEAKGLRRRRVYRITSSGEAALKLWLLDPIKPRDVQRGTGELMLRFGFMEQVHGAEGCIYFLNNVIPVLQAYLVGLETYLAAQADSMPLSGRLALESGIRSYRGLNEWAAYALGVYQKLQTDSKSRSTGTWKGGPK